MTNTHSSDWDDSELVPLGELRPSREYFGPLIRANSKTDRPGSRTQSNKQQSNKQQSNKQQPNRQQANRQQANRPEGQAPRRSEREPERSDGAARNVRSRADAQEPRPQGRAPQPEQRPAKQRPVDQRPAEQRPARPQVRQERPAHPEPQPAASQRAPQQRAPQPRAPQPRAPQPRSNQPQYRPDPRRAESRRGESPITVKPTAGLRSVFSKSGGKEKVDSLQLLRAPITDGTLAVFSRKGGVGKTTVSAYLGLTLAEERGGRILAIDGDAEAGSLGWLLAPEAPAMLDALAGADPVPTDYDTLSQYAAETPEGLQVIVGDTDEVDHLDVGGLEQALVQIARNYDISIFDTGGGVSRSAGRVLVRHAKVLLLVMGPSVDSVRAAERTLAYLEERPGVAADPNVQIIAVINGVPNNVRGAQIDQIEGHFAGRCAAVVRIPWDEHLATGSTDVSLNNLNKATRRAFIELASTTVGVLARYGSRRVLTGARNGA